jgi:hypothetical protein
MADIRKAIAKANITEPAAVQARCTAEGELYKEGSIYCEIYELGFFAPQLIYCRYGLSIPYIRVQPGWTLLVEPTVGEDGRWFFTGIADCGSLTPIDADQLLIQLASQVIYASTAGKIHLSSKTASQPFVNGTNLQTWAGNVDQALAALYAWASAGITAGPANVLLTTPNPDATGFPTNALSTKIMGE